MIYIREYEEQTTYSEVTELCKYVHIIRTSNYVKTGYKACVYVHNTHIIKFNYFFLK